MKHGHFFLESVSFEHVSNSEMRLTRKISCIFFFIFLNSDMPRHTPTRGRGHKYSLFSILSNIQRSAPPLRPDDVGNRHSPSPIRRRRWLQLRSDHPCLPFVLVTCCLDLKALPFVFFFSLFCVSMFEGSNWFDRTHTHIYILFYSLLCIEKRDNEFTPIYVETRVPGEKPRLFVLLLFSNE